MAMVVDQEELSRYRRILDSFMDSSVNNIIGKLPEFFSQAALFDTEGNFGFMNLSDYGAHIEMMASEVRDIAYNSQCVGAIIFFPNLVVDLEPDDPNLEAAQKGVLDLTSVPKDKKKINIVVYGEALGPYRKALSIPLDGDLIKNGDVKDLNAKRFDYYPLLKQNSWNN